LKASITLPFTYGLMHDDFFDELVQHGRGQLGEVGVFPDDPDELICFLPILVYSP
jgi:hypothetical protein